MKKYKLLYQSIHVGEIYRNGNDLYRVEGYNDECLHDSVHLRRLRDGWEMDAEGAALYLTSMGIELIWAAAKNGYHKILEQVG